MDLSDEWKSAFPIGSVFSSPLLLSDTKLGPLRFNPDPATRTRLFSSPTLAPPLLDPPHRLSLPRFIATSAPVPHSTAFSISSSFSGPHRRDDAASLLAHNRLQLLEYPGGALVFFSTGANHDQVGFLLVKVEDGSFTVVGGPDGGVLAAHKELGQRIVRILVNPFEGNFSSGGLCTVGYLLVYTLYWVHWFRVQIGSEGGEKPTLRYLGCKRFVTLTIAGACWSPHFPEESLVLLEDGSLLLFDLEESDDCGMYFKGTRVKVLWNEVLDSGGSGKWIGCEFSWHPRILVVAHSDRVFLVDWRFRKCNVTCLADMGMLGVYALAEKDRFLTFSRSASSYFHFVLVSDNMLVLCDVRKPLFPLLQWSHGFDKPGYVDVFRLSELRSNSRDDTLEWATSSGCGIILGSFWNCEFALFCYGQPLPTSGGSVTSEIPNTLKSVYAWELPSELLLSGNQCHCGSCLAREEFWRDSIPDWIDWQQKKKFILGFGILSNCLSSSLSEAAEYGGFTLIRLMSSGNLETQRYNASWTLLRKLESAHQEPLTCPKANLLYDFGDEDYKFRRKFKYLKLDYLCSYLNSLLAQVLSHNLTKRSQSSQEDEAFGLEFHRILCEKLMLCGIGRYRTIPAITSVFNGIGLPTSIHEAAVQKLWASLPIKLMLFAFSTYSEFLVVLVDQKKVSLEFAAVPDSAELPPFFLKQQSNRSSKWSQKVKPGEAPVGPVVPLPVLTTLHELLSGGPDSEDDMGGFYPEVEISNYCSEVMQVAREMAVRDFSVELQEDTVISLADDRNHIEINPDRHMPFVLHSPTLDLMTSGGQNGASVSHVGEKHTYLISKFCRTEPVSTRCNKLGLVGREVFDDLCPVDLKFGDAAADFRPQESKHLNSLHREYSKFLRQFAVSQELRSQFLIRRRP